MDATRPPSEPSAIVLFLDGRIGPADVPGLCERLRALLERSTAEVVDCDVAAIVEPDAGTLDALARLQLTACRLGCRLRIRHASSALQELLAFTGLRDVVT